MRINIKNQNRKRKIDVKRIKKITGLVLKSLKIKNAGVNIVFVNDKSIRSANKRYLNRSSSTDVLAFPPNNDFPVVREKILGDIMVSSDEADRNAGVYRTSFFYELVLYVIHGVLHLSGYDDISRDDKRSMREKENEIIEKVRHLFQEESVLQRKRGS